MRCEATFNTAKRLLGDVLALNRKTVVMRLDVDSRVVKRHRAKHHVRVWE